MGVFQIESRAQMSMLPRTRPENLDDLTVQVALVRPGPILGGAVHPYIQRKKALREDPSYVVPYEHPSLEPVLRDTLGAIVFQDQVIEVAMAFAGFTAGDAEGLRRAMSRKRSEAAMRAYEDQFVAGAVALHGASEELAHRVYDQIVGFSGFGFPKSHSAAFGLLAYQSTWLRVHYAPEFLCALMNEQPMGFYPPDTLAHEAQRRGIEVRAPCVRRSGLECAVEADLGVRVGLGYVSGVRSEEVEALVAERERGGPFRVDPRPGRALGHGRRRAGQAGLGRGVRRAGGRPAPGAVAAGRGRARRAGGKGRHPARPAAGPARRARAGGAGVWDRLLADYGSIGVTLHEHPLELMRPTLPDGCFSSADLARARDGTPVRCAGLVVARQRPATAKGVTFMLLEDEFGTLNLIVPPPVHERCRLAVRGEPLIIASGKLEHREGVTNVLVHDVQRLDRGDLPQGRDPPHRAAAHVVVGGRRGRGADERSARGGAGGQQLRQGAALGLSIPP